MASTDTLDKAAVTEIVTICGWYGMLEGTTIGIDIYIPTFIYV